jgi:hypothetical protein
MGAHGNLLALCSSVPRARQFRAPFVTCCLGGAEAVVSAPDQPM